MKGRDADSQLRPLSWDYRNAQRERRSPQATRDPRRGGGSSNRRQSPCRPMSNSQSHCVGLALSQVQCSRVVADLHHHSDTSRVSRAEPNLGFAEGPTGNVERPTECSTTSGYLMKYGRFVTVNIPCFPKDGPQTRGARTGVQSCWDVLPEPSP